MNHSQRLIAEEAAKHGAKKVSKLDAVADVVNQSIEEASTKPVYRAGDKVQVPFNGKMVAGKVVRFDSGGTDKARQHGGGYVVDVGQRGSVLIPAHLVRAMKKEEVEQVNEAFSIGTKSYEIQRDQFSKKEEYVLYRLSYGTGSVRFSDGRRGTPIGNYKSKQEAMAAAKKDAGVKEEVEQVDEAVKNYVCFYNRKQIVVQASSSYEAQQKAGAAFKVPPKKQYMIAVKLAEATHFPEEVEEAYAPSSVDLKSIAGAFTEKSGKKRFEYRMSQDSWGKSHGLPHEVWVSENKGGKGGMLRAANVKGTVCIIATDEGADGKPVLDKWAITNHVKYVKAEGLDLDSLEELQLLGEEKIPKQALDMLRIDWSKIKNVNPESPNYKKVVMLLDRLPPDMLKQLVDAKIPFISGLAANRMRKPKKEEVEVAEAKDGGLMTNLTHPKGKAVVTKSGKVVAIYRTERAARKHAMTGKPVKEDVEMTEAVSMKEMGFKKWTGGGMSFRVGRLEGVSANQLIKVFGPPHSKGSSDDKTTMEWGFINQNGLIFTVYDYKNPPKSMSAPHNWSVGGTGDKQKISIQRAFKMMGVPGKMIREEMEFDDVVEAYDEKSHGKFKAGDKVVSKSSGVKGTIVRFEPSAKGFAAVIKTEKGTTLTSSVSNIQHVGK